MSGIPKPSVGDEMILRTPQRRRQDTPVPNRPVRVAAVARFRVTLESVDGEALPWYLREFDLRTGRSWGQKDWTRTELHTEDTLRLQERTKAVEIYLVDSGIWMHELKGTLAKVARADVVSFANALRRFEGLEEL